MREWCESSRGGACFWLGDTVGVAVKDGDLVYCARLSVLDNVRQAVPGDADGSWVTGSGAGATANPIGVYKQRFYSQLIGEAEAHGKVTELSFVGSHQCP